MLTVVTTAMSASMISSNCRRNAFRVARSRGRWCVRARRPAPPPAYAGARPRGPSPRARCRGTAIFAGNRFERTGAGPCTHSPWTRRIRRPRRARRARRQPSRRSWPPSCRPRRPSRGRSEATGRLHLLRDAVLAVAHPTRSRHTLVVLITRRTLLGGSGTSHLVLGHGRGIRRHRHLHGSDDAIPCGPGAVPRPRSWWFR